ncbi:MAG: hypothetical protein SPK90_02265 [Bacteroidales bacterium]|nr:hypothetical protein [Bacteroidales bacterium]MDY6406123.1 hypothetical protein [Bacteroidales bacterium]
MLTFISLSAQVTDRDLLDAYHREDMSIWKTYVDSVMANRLQVTGDYLLYEYGYCGYIVAEAKKEGKESLLPEAKRYVKQYKQHVEALKNHLPKGHYEMYQSAVYVYELRLHESIHPFNAMSLAKEATKLAPNDPLVLSYYGTCLFYSPKPFGSKSDALKWFEKAQPLFADEQYTYCWVRKANEMYIQQCHDKLKK